MRKLMTLGMAVGISVSIGCYALAEDEPIKAPIKESPQAQASAAEKELSLEELKTKAQNSDLSSQLELGNRFQLGQYGTPVDYKQALAWYQKVIQNMSAGTTTNTKLAIPLAARSGVHHSHLVLWVRAIIHQFRQN